VKQAFEFLKQTIVAGFFVLLPIVLIAKILAEVVKLARKVAAPVLTLLPHGFVMHASFPALFAILVVLLTCLLFGLLTRLAFVRNAGNWTEQHLLNLVPGYRAVRNLTRGFTDSSDVNAFKAAVLKSPKESSLVYLIEDHGNGFATVMVPSSPTPMAGSIKIVPREHVEILNVKMSAVARVLTQCGVGTHDLLRKTNGPISQDASRTI
jgi:uncharacterized membrane protein